MSCTDAPSSVSRATAIITGANRGLGLELTRRYLARQWQVIAGCRRPSEAAELHPLTQAHGDRLRVLACDLLDGDSIRRFGRASLSIAPHIDLLINNAGYLDRTDNALANADEDSLMLAYRTNALAPLLLTRELLDGLRAAKSGRIVNISSAMGSMGFAQAPGSYGYRMSKAALNMLTVNLAAELEGSNVVVVALHPGWVQTDMGGSDARLSVAESADGLVQVIDSLEPADAGRLIRYDGDRLPF